MPTPDDTQFGQVHLSWDDFHWSGNVIAPLFGESIDSDVELNVNTKDQEHVIPCEEQHQAWKTFLDANVEWYQKGLNRILAYYIKMRPQYAKAGPKWVASMPDISTIQQVSR